MVKPISDIRRPEIVQATIKAITKRGLPMPSYDQIAHEAGMSRQLIRHYFPDPETLMIAVCDAMASAYRDLLAAGVLKTNAAQRLPLFLDLFFNQLPYPELRKPKDDAVYDAIMAIAAGSPVIREALHEQYTVLQHTIAHEVQISHPTLSQKACREIGFLFSSLMYGHWTMVGSLGFAEGFNKVTREALDRIIQSYLERYDDPDLK